MRHDKHKGLRLASADNDERMCRQDKSKENNQENAVERENSNTTVTTMCSVTVNVKETTVSNTS
jgi:hypothetical protein